MAEMRARTPTIGGLFKGFLLLGLTGFGGVLPLARHMVVEKRRWLTGAEFIELLSLCQFLPGGNIINLSVAIGLHFRGIPGAVAAMLGLIAAPTVDRAGAGRDLCALQSRSARRAHVRGPCRGGRRPADLDGAEALRGAAPPAVRHRRSRS